MVMILSYELGLQEFNNPGPGLLPFVASVFILVISSYLILSNVFQKGDKHRNMKEEEEKKEKPNYKRIAFVLSSLFVYALILERIGFLITTLIVLIFMFRGVGYRWRFVVTISVITVIVTYCFFSYLGVRFPMGILESLRFPE